MAKQFATNHPGLKPAAWIVTPNDKGRKSIKNGKVFLNDGDEFEIEIWNPLQVSVLADIKLNSQSISKTGLVVKPGQRVYIDCFIDDKKKFIFKTYEIESSLDTLQATEKNGLLEVFFYKEEVVTINNWKSKFDRLIVEKWYPVYYPTYPSYNPIIWCNTNNSPTFTAGSFTTTGNNIIGSVFPTTNAYYSTSNSCYTSNVDLSNLNIGGSLTSNSNPINSSIETGRVEKGKESKQKFTEVDMDFEQNYIASTIIQILPESRKPAEIKQVKGKFNDIKIKKDSNDIIDLIKKLGELHKQGLITDEEFTEKKKELLSKI